MKGIIYYYSGAGNTALACRYIARHLSLPFDLVDVTLERNKNIAPADIYGFAASTDFWGIPQAFESFLETFPGQKGTPAFVFNTFGAISGKTLKILAALVAKKQMKIIAGHSLRMPESYPPMIVGGMGAQNEPGKKGISRLNSFISEINKVIADLRQGQNIEAHNLNIGFINSLMPLRARVAARENMGHKYVDSALCIECGICEKGCPYQAIRLEPKPVFDMNKCYGCWRCFNNCPSKAIYTKKLRNKGYYKGPSEVLKKKMMA
jgi:ferredoxin/flavodoxin